MQRIKFNEIFAYLFVSVLAVGLAFALSLGVLKKAQSQSPAPSGVNSNGNASVPELAQPNSPEPGAPSAADSEDFARPSFPSVNSTTEDARNIEVFLEPFIYDEKERRDPFLEFMQSANENNENLGPLQRYPLGSLVLMGIIWDVKSPKAMFISPDKQVHVIGLDQGIGNKNGYIASIREGEVVVVEAERSDAGLEYFTRVIPLPR